MIDDVIQVGPWLVSKSFLDAVLPLVGVFIGGLITYWSTVALEKRRWKKEAEEKKREKRQKALELALEWIDPIKNALTKAELMVNSYKKGHLEQELFQRDYPNIIPTLVEKDLPRSLIVFLSWDLYHRGIHISERFEELYITALRDKGLEGLVECWELSSELRKDVDNFTEQLENEYLKTFD